MITSSGSDMLSMSRASSSIRSGIEGTGSQALDLALETIAFALQPGELTVQSVELQLHLLGGQEPAIAVDRVITEINGKPDADHRQPGLPFHPTPKIEGPSEHHPVLTSRAPARPA